MPTANESEIADLCLYCSDASDVIRGVVAMINDDRFSNNTLSLEKMAVVCFTLEHIAKGLVEKADTADKSRLPSKKPPADQKAEGKTAAKPADL